MALIAVGVALVSGAVGGALWVVAIFAALTAAVAVAVWPEWSLLGMIILREVIHLIPEFSVAGRIIGIDGMITYGLIAGMVLSLPVRKHVPLFHAITICALLFLTVCALSLTRSLDPIFGARQCVRFFSYLVFFWIAASANPDRFGPWFMRAIRVAALIVLSLGVAELILIFSQMSFSEYVNALTSILGSTRLAGFRELPHAYGYILLMIAPLVAYTGLQSKRRPQQLFWLAVVGVCAAFIIMTGVRSVAGAFAIEMAALLLLTRRFVMLGAFAALFVVIGFGTGIVQARMDVFLNPLRAGIEWDSLTERRETWYLLNIASNDRPLRGHGIGSVEIFVAESPLKHRSTAASAHSDYRKFWFETGVPGAVLYVAVMGLVIYYAFRSRSRPGVQGHIACCVVATGLAWLTIAFVDEVLQDFHVMTIWWTCAGIAIAHRVQSTPEETPDHAV